MLHLKFINSPPSSPYQYHCLQKLVKEGSINSGSKKENMQYWVSSYEMLGFWAYTPNKN